MAFDLTRKNNFNRNLAVVIGIDNYNSPINPLATPSHDAQRLAEILKDTYRYTIHKCLTGQVERPALEDLFEKELPALNLTGSDRLIIYFASHGVAVKQKGTNAAGEKDSSSFNADVPTGYLLPSNASANDLEGSCLSMDWFYKQVQQLPCRHLLIILDCCFAGTIRWSVTTRAEPILPAELYRKQYERFITNPSWVVLTSAAHDEEAIDVIGSPAIIRGEEGQIHSPFAEALFQALTDGKGNADYVPDGIITAGELELFLRHELIKKTGSHLQTASLWRLRPEDKGEFLFLLPSARPDRLPKDPELSPENNPYRGLEAYNFDKEQSPLFFGRTKATIALGDAVDKRRLTLVLGASGTGKSSLVKAGLMPMLAGWIDPFTPAGAAPEKAEQQRPDWANPEDWRVLPPFTPGRQPLKALDDMLNDKLGQEGAAEAKITPASLKSKISKLLQGDKKILLVIDQFEELVTRSEAELRRDFLDLLEALLEDPEFENLRLVLTLRTDFEARFRNDRSPFGRYWQKADTWRQPSDDHQSQSSETRGIPLRFIVPPLSRDEFREAIVGPATRRVLYFETPQLVEEMIDEVLQMPGGLPRLSFTLDVMYRHYIQQATDNKREDRTFTRKDYETVGGVAGSLSKQANDLYDALPDDNYKDTMRRIILRMITIQDGNVTRRRVYRDELDYGNTEEKERNDYILEKLVEARLLVRGSRDMEPIETGNSNGESIYYEPGHDALIDGWDKVAEWRRAERVETKSDQFIPGDEVIALQRRVTDAANRWVKARTAGEQADLWDDSVYLPQVEQVLEKEHYKQDIWLKQWWFYFFPRELRLARRFWLNTVEMNFIRESLRKRCWNRQKFAASVIAFILIVLMGAGATTYFGIEANRQARISRARELAAQSQAVLDRWPQRSLLLAVEAANMITETGRIPIVEQALHDALLKTGGIPLSGHTGAVETVAFSPDNRWLATGSSDGTVRLRDLQNMSTAPTVLSGHPGHGVSAVAFSPNNQWLATGSKDDDGTILLWDMNDFSKPKHILEDGQGGILDLEFSSDGQWLVSVGFDDPKARLWDPEALNVDPIPLTGHTKYIMDVAFSRDSQWLATGSQDETALLWDMNDLIPYSHLYHAGSVSSVAFSPDSLWLATGSFDGTVKLWKVNDPAIPFATLMEHKGYVETVAFSPDMRWLVTAGRDNTAILWDMASIYFQDPEPSFVVLSGHEDTIETVAFSSDGEWLVTGSLDSTVRLWKVSQLTSANNEQPPTPFRILENHEGHINAVTFSPNSRWIATVGSDNMAWLWNVHGPPGLPYRLVGQTDEIKAINFSANSKWLMSGSTNGRVHLWDLNNPITSTPSGFSNPSQIRDFGFSRDGQWFAIPGVDSHIYLWNTDNLADRQVLFGDGEIVNAVAFSPDNQWVASVGEKGATRLWKLDNPIPTPISLLESEGDAWYGDVVFSSDSKWVATGNNDSTVQLWSVNDQTNPITLVDPEARSAITLVAFSPDDRWLVAVEKSRPVAQLWHVDNPTAPHFVLSGHDFQINTLAFSPDNKWLATGSGDELPTIGRDFNNHTVLLWNLQEPDPSTSPIVLTGHEGSINSLSFSPDNRWLVSGGQDKMIRLWDMNDLTAPPLVLSGHKDRITAVAFSPDSQWLATGSVDNTIQLWSLDVEVLRQKACEIVGRNLTIQEWEQYFLDESYRRTCQEWPIHYSVNEALVEELVKEAWELVQSNDINAAAEKYAEARRFDPNIPEQAIELALLQLAEQSARRGDFEEAMVKFRAAEDRGLDPTEKVINLALNEICIPGVLQGYGAEIIEACNYAIENALSEEDRMMGYLLRGIAHASIDDLVEAHEDLDTVAKILIERGEEILPNLEGWITDLENGTNPFNEEMLKEMYESFKQ